MKIVISPAKSLDFSSLVPIKQYTQPIFLEEATKLNKKMSSFSKKKISELMHISNQLADLNYQRYQNFKTPFSSKNARQAIFAFSGDVYTGLDAYSLSQTKVKKLQDSLRILSGLYGILKPLDLIQPYRLEMGTSLKINRKKNLYDFWGNKITEVLNSELSDNELLINLASKEYFKVIHPKLIKTPIISPIFKDYKNGKLKIISFFAKKARGSMTRFIIDKDCKSLEDLKEFNYLNYGFSEEFTKNPNEPVFIR
ncbi:MAG: peroxide stress protein YaaA [Flavobacteriales bacterium]